MILRGKESEERAVWMKSCGSTGLRDRSISKCRVYVGLNSEA